MSVVSEFLALESLEVEDDISAKLTSIVEILKTHESARSDLTDHHFKLLLSLSETGNVSLCACIFRILRNACAGCPRNSALILR